MSEIRLFVIKILNFWYQKCLCL